MATIALRIIGTEILEGRLLDTNSHWLTGKLRAHGHTVESIVVCPDTPDQMKRAFTSLPQSVDAVITTGGLGPTSDDLTTAILAELAETPLQLDEEILEAIKERFKTRSMPFPESNKKQAMIPKGAAILSNPHGTAPGISLELEIEGRAVPFFACPGVPGELKPMIESHVLPALRSQQEAEPPVIKELTLFGLPESEVAQRIDSLGLEGFEISYLASLRHIRLQLTFPPSEGTLADSTERALIEVLEAHHIYAQDNKKTLAPVVKELLEERSSTVALAESCTGGTLAGLLTAEAGISSVFAGSTVPYSNEAKQTLLRVPKEVFEDHGAVSKECAYYLAANTRTVLSADYALSLTGIAGPSGGYKEKPTGTVYIGVATPEHVWVGHFLIARSRNVFQEYASWCALDMLRRHILNLPMVNMCLQGAWIFRADRLEER